MRNPGRRDSGDSRQDRGDEPATQAAGVDAPEDGDVAATPVPDEPHRTLADDAVPRNTAPADTMPDDTMPDDAVAAEPISADPTLDDRALDDPALDDPALDDPASDGTTPDTADGPDPDDGVAAAAGPAGHVELNLGDLTDDLGDFPDDDLLFDPLLSDEPIDLAAVRADDALIDALAGGDPAAARGFVDVDDPLIAMLAAWAASARPDGSGTAADRPALTVVGGQAGCATQDDDTADDDAGADPVDGTAPAEPADAEVPERTGPAAVPLLRPVGRPARPPAAALDDATAGSAADEPVTIPALFPVHSASTAIRATAGEPPTVPALDPILGVSTATGAADEPATVPALDPVRGASSTRDGTTVRRLRRPPIRGIERVGLPRRRTGPGARPIPPGHLLRRAAVAVVLACLAVSGAAATGGTARPGDAGFPMTRVFFAERAKSLEAAEVVATGLSRARVYLEHRRPDLAAQELAAVDVALPDVRDEEGHTGLVDQQQVLETAVALAPPFTPDPTASTTDADRPRGRSDPSILAEAAPSGTAATDGSGSDGTGSDGTGSNGTGSDGTGSDGKRPEARTSAGSAADSAEPDGTDVLAAPGDGTGGSTGSGRSTAKDDAPLAATTSTVGGATDQGRASADPSAGDTTPAPTSATTSTRPSAPTSAASGTDGPTGSTPTGSGTATSTSPTSTTRDTPDPDRGTDAGSGGGGSSPADTGSGSVAAVPAGAGSAFIVRPAAHHDAAPEPVEPVVARRHSTDAGGTTAPTGSTEPTEAAKDATADVAEDDATDDATTGADTDVATSVPALARGSVVAGSDDPPSTVVPEAAASAAERVVVTTVPPPTPVEPRNVPAGAHHKAGHRAKYDVAGTHTSGIGEIDRHRSALRVSRVR